MKKNSGLIGIFLAIAFLGLFNGLTNLIWGGNFSKIGWSLSIDPAKKVVFNFCLAAFGFLISGIIYFKNKNKY